MKNNYFTKKPKKCFIAFLILFCGLFANTVMGQAQGTFTWKTTGGVDNNWTTPGNWTKTGTTSGSGAADTFPGETLGRRFDIAIVATGATAVAPVIPARVDAYAVYRLDINNSATVPTGAVVTVDIGATLNIGDQNSNQVRLFGGTLINNGAVNISSTGAGFTSFPVTGIIGLSPTSLPTVPTEYGYKGTGTLSINMPNANFANSGAISVTGNSAAVTTPNDNANVTYKFELNNPTITLGPSAGATIAAIRAAGGNNANKLIIAGTGLTMGTVGTPMLKPSLIILNPGANVTVNAGTTLTQYVDAASATNTITLFSSGAAFTTNLTNNGTINILGASTRSGLNFSTGILAAGPPITTAKQVFNFTNNGTFNVNMNIPSSNFAPIATSDGGGYNVSNAFNIVNTGVMSLTNSGTGTALYASQAYNAPPLTLTNSGTLNLNGATSSGSPTFANIPNIKASINNSGVINSNNELANAVFTNTSTGTIAFANAAAGATANALVTGTFVTNDGKIQTGSGSAKLNNIGLIAALSATSSVEPGGSGKGIADFNKTGSAVVLGKLVVQVAGNTAAGTDFDQIKNSFLDGGFDVTGATLDVTGISGTATPVDIVLANGVGTIAGPFASVIGLTSGWSVDYSTAGKVQLVYSAASPTSNLWTGGTSTDWTDGTNWSAGVPDQNSDVTIGTGTFQPTIATNVNINSLAINVGATLAVTVNNLTVTGAITNSGSMSLASNANLIQGGTTNTNAGNITVTRNSNALSRLDYTIWSSPVAVQELLAFSPATDLSRFYNYNETTNFYNAVTPSGTPFTIGAGYLIRMPNTAVTAPATQTFAGAFTGIPNNGNISKAVTYLDATHGYNMLGNPYPSTIDAQAFILANTLQIENSLYFWRKINGAAGSAYAVYNSLGATTATPSSALPNGTIQVGQGFFVKAKVGATSVSFTNALRVANTGNQFFKTKQVAKDRVWLNLSNTAGAFSQVLVGYTADATSGVDMYDAKYFNDSATALTSNINNEEYTIQGRQAFDASDVVALNFKTDAAGDYTIALDHFDGVFATGQDIYLKDNTTGAETDLKAGGYAFTATAGVDNTRFSLKYQKTLKVDVPVFNDNSVRVYKNNGLLYVNSGSVAINNIKVFDIQGRLIAEQKEVKATTAIIKNLKATYQVLIVKITGEDNNVVTKKVVN